MSAILPLVPSIAHYTFSTTIEGAQYAFTVRWNGRDAAWYLDMFDVDGAPMAIGMRVVLGAFLGRRSTHDFFTAGGLYVTDLSNVGREATFDDLGVRVRVQYMTQNDLLAAAAGDL